MIICNKLVLEDKVLKINSCFIQKRFIYIININQTNKKYHKKILGNQIYPQAGTLPSYTLSKKK